MRKNSIKNTRVNIEVQRALGTLINRELKDPRINPMTTIVGTEVAPDLKTAKIYISVLGDEDSKESTLKGLKSAASFLRGQLARELNLRHTPELTFIIDSSIEYGVNISKLINEVNKNNHISVDVEAKDDFTDDEDTDI
ncbi:MAG: 30S ribosome-binding factor RbfA [Clostridiales bacterium]|nr:30S ribosome-binding factor RbfA [Clostridiales bacterium]